MGSPQTYLRSLMTGAQQLFTTLTPDEDQAEIAFHPGSITVLLTLTLPGRHFHVYEQLVYLQLRYLRQQITRSAT